MPRKHYWDFLLKQQYCLTEDDVRFYDALVNNAPAVRELSDGTLKKIAHELTENLRQKLSVDWSARGSVQAKLRLMVKRILRKYKYPPDQQAGRRGRAGAAASEGVGGGLGVGARSAGPVGLSGIKEQP